MTGPSVAGRAAELDVRITAHVFERAFGRPPTGIRRVPGVLTLLGGGAPDRVALTAAVAWGVIVAFADGDDAVDLYSMNRHADRFAAAPADLRRAEAPSWADEPLAAFRARPVPPPARMVVNRELPAAMGLFSGAEARCAVALGLDDLHGPSGGGEPPGGHDPVYTSALHARAAEALLVAPGGVERLPCDLAASGLRLLIIDLGAPGTPPPPPAPVEDALTGRAAAALRAGRTADLGPLLTEARVRGVPALDGALDAARDAGALGGRTIGSCAVALVPMEAVPRVRARVAARLAGMVKRSPRFLTAVPVAGAGPGLENAF